MSVTDKVKYDQLVDQLRLVFQQHHDWLDAEDWLRASLVIAGAYFSETEDFDFAAFTQSFREGLHK